MKQFTIEISSDYGHDCIGYEYGSSDSDVLNPEGETAEVLAREIESHGGELTMETVLELINNGETCLQSVHDQIHALCVDMDIEYWLEEAYDSEIDVLFSHIEDDMENGRFVPDETFEEFCASYGEDEDEDEIGDDLDEDFLQSEYLQYLCDYEYASWLQTLSKEEQAERVGLDINAVIEDCISNYTIKGE